MRRTVKTFALAGIATLAMAVSSAIPAQAAARLNASTYVALGDSYSSGALLGGNLDPTCDRSSAAYPVVLAGGTNFVSFKACSGATIEDTLAVLPATPQPNVKVVTLTVGFNDTDWAAAVAALLAGDTTTAQTLLMQTAAEIAGPVAHNIPGLIASLRTAYPKARIFWGGYVRQFGAEEIIGIPDTCVVAYGNPLSLHYAYVPNALAGQLDGLVAGMNTVIRGAVFVASTNGVPITYVDADAHFTGLRACNDPAPAVFNLHPTVAGQLLYAKAFAEAGVAR